MIRRSIPHPQTHRSLTKYTPQTGPLSGQVVTTGTDIAGQHVAYRWYIDMGFWRLGLLQSSAPSNALRRKRWAEPGAATTVWPYAQQVLWLSMLGTMGTGRVTILWAQQGVLSVLWINLDSVWCPRWAQRPGGHSLLERSWPEDSHNHISLQVSHIFL